MKHSSHTIISDFIPVTEEEVGKIIKGTAPKSCCVEPVPTEIVKECLDILPLIITRIINQSLWSAHVPKAFKLVAVTPIIKKIDLIAEPFKNFRPISNIPLPSKVMEKVAAKQLVTHKEMNSL